MESDNYKSETQRAYELFTEKFSEKFEKYFRDNIQTEADIFIRFLRGPKIVDLGSGGGSHASYFEQKGLDVLCIDLSPAMVELCKKKGLKAQVMDIEYLKLPEKSFDGVWAYASLLHIKKAGVPKVIQTIKRVLKPQGIFGFAVKEGEGERLEINEKYPDTRRWFTYFTDNEIRELMEKDFEFLHSSKTVKEKYVFLNYVVRLKT